MTAPLPPSADTPTYAYHAHMYTANDVARYFLALADNDAGDEVMSHLKLQKLCYYAQGFNLAIYDEPLFEERIEAWTHGPVVPAIWHQYKDHGGAGIPAPDDFDSDEYDDDTAELLDEVYAVYGQYSAWKLRNMTHEEPPWKDAYRPGFNRTITHDALREYFVTLVEDDEEED